MLYHLYWDGEQELVLSKNPHFDVFKDAMNSIVTDVFALIPIVFGAGLSIAAIAASCPSGSVPMCVVAIAAAAGTAGAFLYFAVDLATNWGAAEENFNSARTWKRKNQKGQRR
ncbi:MAG: hypothetical protein MI924_21530 [Chloroflexales bacterium]|nr:hypothetical protein [Chloroflexales bacterium]